MGAGASDYFTSYADVSHGYLDAELAMDDLHTLAACGRFHQVRIRLKQGLDPNGVERDADSDSDSDGGDEHARGDTPLICAARGHRWNKGREQHVRTMAILVEFGADVNKYNRLEQTALFVACDRNLLLVAEWLVQHGADANKASKSGETPIMCAYRHQNAALVDILLRHGASVTRPPQQLSCLKIPTLLDQVAVKATTKAAIANDQEESPPSLKANEQADVLAPTARASTAAGPTRRQWLPRVGGSSNPRPSTTPGTMRAPKTSVETLDGDQRIERAIAKAHEHEREVRCHLMKQIKDAQRIEDQRVYHAQLAGESRKRRERRRAQRESASRQRQQVAAERKMEGVKALMRPTSGSESNDSRPPTHKAELLAWERTVDATTSSRPKWTAQPVWSTAAQPGGGPSTLQRDCETLLSSIHCARERRERLLALPSLVRPETAPTSISGPF